MTAFARYDWVMPELPEVETIRRGLLPILGTRITRVHINRLDVVHIKDCLPERVSQPDQSAPIGRMSAAAMAGQLGRDCVVGDLVRYGKQLAIVTNGPTVVVQLGMTGSLTNTDSDAMSGGGGQMHAHVVWHLADGRRVVFRDPRRFGRIVCLPGADALADHWQGLGEDALSITPMRLWRRLQRTRRAIKAALLDQSVLAGLGNIYVDELLFRARVRPTTAACQLELGQTQRLVRQMRQLLGCAIEHGGSTVRDYRNANRDAGSYQAQHRVYGRAGQLCTRCGNALASGQVAGRTTVWCPACQGG